MSGTRPSSAASRDIDRMLHSMQVRLLECSTSSGLSRDARRPAWVAGRPVSFCLAVEIVTSRLSRNAAFPTAVPSGTPRDQGFLSAVVRHDISSEKMSSAVRLYKHQTC